MKKSDRSRLGVVPGGKKEPTQPQYQQIPTKDGIVFASSPTAKTDTESKGSYHGPRPAIGFSIVKVKPGLPVSKRRLVTAKKADRPEKSGDRIKDAEQALTQAFAEVARQQDLTNDELEELIIRLSGGSLRAAPKHELTVADERSLPKKAPTLWAYRDKNLRMTPPAFIRAVYGPWFGKGFTRGTLREFDKSLYQAYANWIFRYPEDAISELPAQTTEIEDLLARLTKVATLDELRRVGLALQTRRTRNKI